MEELLDVRQELMRTRAPIVLSRIPEATAIAFEREFECEERRNISSVVQLLSRSNELATGKVTVD